MGLNKLPESYPHPSNTLSTNLIAITRTANHGVTSQKAMRESPSVFDGQIKTMEGEKFHISLTDDAKPFCVNAPRTVQIQAQGRARSSARTRHHHTSHGAH